MSLTVRDFRMAELMKEAPEFEVYDGENTPLKEKGKEDVGGAHEQNGSMNEEFHCLETATK